MSQENGYLATTHASTKLATVKITLCGLKCAFMYVRQVLKSLPSEFFCNAKIRIGQWMLGLRSDILQQCHRIREDVIIATLVQVLSV